MQILLMSSEKNMTFGIIKSEGKKSIYFLLKKSLS